MAEMQAAAQKASLNGEPIKQLFWEIVCRPSIEISLKQESGGSLPTGLEVVARRHPQDESGELFPLLAARWRPSPMPPTDSGDSMASITAAQVEPKDQFSLSCLMKSHSNNYLSFLKCRPLLKTICICMYNESWNELKATLEGVSENLVRMYGQGYDQDQFAVFVVADGMAPLSSELLLGLERAQEQSSSPRAQILRHIDPLEQEFRRESSLAHVRDKYLAVKRELDFIQRGATKIRYDDLSQTLQRFYKQAARDYHERKTKGADNASDEKLVELYAFNRDQTPILMQKTFRSAKKYCQSFIKSRASRAHLTHFKMVPLCEADQSLRINFFFCAKYQNAQKLSSHNWFFSGFCNQLSPSYAVLLDVGLKPGPQSLKLMIEHLQQHQQLGGVCGYMKLKPEALQAKQKQYRNHLNWLSQITDSVFDIQRAQRMQYHLAHLIDKPFESSFGFVHVLPGAFSAYTWHAIKGTKRGTSSAAEASTGQMRENLHEPSLVNQPNSQSQSHNLLKDYLSPLAQKIIMGSGEQLDFSIWDLICRMFLPLECFSLKPVELMLYNQNVNLAQDRILCQGIFLNGYEMAFIPEAVAAVDSMKTLHETAGQRKRWNNGSTYAFRQVRANFLQRGASFALSFQLLYMMVVNWMSYISPSLLLYSFSIAMNSFSSEAIVPWLGTSPYITSLPSVFNFILVILFCSLVLHSLFLNHREPLFIRNINLMASLFGLFALATTAILFVDLVKGFSQGTQLSSARDSWQCLKLVYCYKFMLTNSLLSAIILYISSRSYAFTLLFTYAFIMLMSLISLIKIVGVVIYYCRRRKITPNGGEQNQTGKRTNSNGQNVNNITKGIIERHIWEDNMQLIFNELPNIFYDR